MTNSFKLLFIGFLISASINSFPAEGNPIKVRETSERIEIENEYVKLVIIKGPSNIQQNYFARVNDRWEEVAGAFIEPDKTDSRVIPLYERRPGVANRYRLMSNDGLQTARVDEKYDDSVRVVLNGVIDDNTIEEIITLHAGDNFFHIGIRADLKERRLEYLLSSFFFSLPGNPDFTFVPSLKRADDDVIGDRKFFAPAAIIEKNGYMMALVPDLNLINKNIIYAKGARPVNHPRMFAVPFDTNRISMPTALDLTLHPGVSPHPLISYGFVDYWAEQHVYWRHDNNNGDQIRQLSSNRLHYGFDLFIKGGANKTRGYEEISYFLWQKYGQRYFKMPRPQVMPFADYAKVCYPAAFSYEGYDVIKGPYGPKIRQRQNHPLLASWQQWDDHGIEMGGLRLSAPQWYQFIYNTSWWNNVSDAIGMYYWGKKTRDSSLIDKARRIINFTLSSPQQGGIFPALYDIYKKSWVASMWKPPLNNYNPDSTATYFNWKDGEYQTSSASTTAAFLLIYMKTCEDDPGILPFVRRYGDFLVKNLRSDGCVPAWFNKGLKPLPSLEWNAEGGLHMWVLSELYSVSRDQSYLAAAKKMAKFITDKILPREKWFDFETFYSCAVKPETFYDKWTGQYPANTMSVFWAMEGFASLYQVTKQPEYLKSAEAIADYSIFYQAVWAPHYIITAYPFGGFSSQNSDAEWLDQRSHLFADALVRIGLLSSRQDLLERGVAAARASLTLTNLPENIKNNIYRFPNYPLGLGPENIDHEGFPQMPLRSGPSWAEVGGLFGAASVLRQLGGAYVDFNHSLGIGVNGVSVTHYSLTGNVIRIHMQSLLAGLKFPYEKAFTISLNIKGLEKQNYTLLLNDDPGILLSSQELERLPVMIDPNGHIRIKGMKLKSGAKGN
ncbi:MAG TPA: hypothetical protein VMU83_14875 [Hanamia sp.]|nr:hypothetical protein [Hanamia sp.]